MKKNTVFFVILSCIYLLWGHSGRTDASGGHYNRKTGGYHYHNGGYSQSTYSTSYSKGCGHQCVFCKSSGGIIDPTIGFTKSRPHFEGLTGTPGSKGALMDYLFHKTLADLSFEKGEIKDALNLYLYVVNGIPAVAEDSVNLYGALSAAFYDYGDYLNSLYYAKKLITIAPENSWANKMVIKALKKVDFISLRSPSKTSD